ncbi:hypothetical protein MTO96_028902 [Rhipicephalus appendiculatus]
MGMVYVENVRKDVGVKPRRQGKRCTARDKELWPSFLRRELDQDLHVRCNSGGLVHVQGRDLLSDFYQGGSCSG